MRRAPAPPSPPRPPGTSTPPWHAAGWARATCRRSRSASEGPVPAGRLPDGPVGADPMARCGSGSARSAPVPPASWCSVAVLPSCPPPGFSPARREGSARSLHDDVKDLRQVFVGVAGVWRQLGEPDEDVLAGGVTADRERHGPAHVRLACHRRHGVGCLLALGVAAVRRALRVAVADLDVDVGALNRPERDRYRAEPDRLAHVKDEPGSLLEAAEDRVAYVKARSPGRR